MADVIDLLYSGCTDRGFYREPENIKGGYSKKIAFKGLGIKDEGLSFKRFY